jgi:shikimate kinase
LENASDRPALTKGNFLDELEEIWNERKDRYHLFADTVVNTEGKNHEEIVQEIMKNL